MNSGWGDHTIRTSMDAVSRQLPVIARRVEDWRSRSSALRGQDCDANHLLLAGLRGMMRCQTENVHMQSESPKRSFRALLLGFAAFILFLALDAVFHEGSRIFDVAIATEVVALAVMAERISDWRPWRQGLLAGLGLCAPLLVMAFCITRLRFRTWAWGPYAPLLLMCGCMLLVVSAGAQSVGLWRSHRRIVGVLVSLGTIILAAAGFFAANLLLRDSPLRAQVDKPLPALALTTFDGKPIPLTALQGHITVIDFWGTWCGPCLAELPSVDAVYNEYASDPKVRFLLVNTEIMGDTPEKIAQFVQRRPVSMPMALDPLQTYVKVNGTEWLPLLLVVDQRGRIRFEDSAYGSADQVKLDLHQEIETLLAAN
jgi:thiol-disulfide isomerase/thioredoxin